MKKTFAMILALAMMFTLAACSDGSAEQKTSEENTTSSPENTAANSSTNVAWEDTVVRVAIDSDPGTLGPYESNNSGRKQTLYSVYETLAMYQERGTNVQGVMAKNWYEDGENTYVIELYDYIHDSIGNQITADDVIYSLMDAGYSTFKRYCTFIESIEKIDDFTLRMTLNSEDVGTLEHILCNVWIIDQESYEGTGDNMANNPIGTGPYVVKDYVLGSTLTLVANEDYWQKEELRVKYQYQNVKTIECVVITETAQKIIAMETGTVDIFSKATYADASSFVDNDNYLVTTAKDNNTIFLILNSNEQSVLSNQLLRQAVLYAIDNQELVDGVLDGHGEACYTIGNDLYSDVEDSWADMDYYDYNPEKAKELLKEAGYEDGVSIRIMTTTDSTFGKIASILQAYLGQVGINATIDQYETTLAKTYMHDFSTFDIYINDAGSPDYIISTWISYLSNTIYEDQLNYAGVNDEVLEAMLQEAVNVNGHTSENMTALHEYIAEHAYMYGLMNKELFVVNSSIITEPCVNGDNWLLPGCCTYVWND